MTSSSKLPTIKRVTPTILELTIPCPMHDDHKVTLASDDDVAEVIANFIAQYVFEHGYTRLYETAADWDEIPF